MRTCGAAARGVMATAAVAAITVSCTMGSAVETMPATPAPASAAPSSTNAEIAWPIKTRDHLDVWLHGFAMLQGDTVTALVPLYRRGYHDDLAVRKNRSNVTTQLDLNRATLAARLRANPGLQAAQFLPLYFASWAEFNGGIDTFLQVDGDARRVNDPETRTMIATLAGVFRTPADRDWLRMFAVSLRDEYDHFYHAYWVQRQQELAPVLARLDSLWTRTYYPKFIPYLRNTQLLSGDFYVSLPIDAEGRTLTEGPHSNGVAVGFPQTVDSAVTAIYVFAHEVSSPVVNSAVSDNTTPVEKREGVADRYTANGLVRGGALLLQRVAPELVDGYERYYVQAAGARIETNVDSTFARVFALPEPIVTAIGRQMDVVMGGI
ncbi:MAG TPA: hypothetical protein VFK13_11920 [Gemmatimonadaceae bacterium]|nr:hypothetical protein [Gemmatimonadaceae bacterium]